jgi:hypothetical protein
MTIVLRRAARAVPVALLAVAMLSACSFSGSVSAATSSAPGSSGSVVPVTGAGTTGATAGGTSSAGPAAGGASDGRASGAGSSGSTSARPGPPPVPAPTSPVHADRCHTSELTGSLAPGGAAAGQRYATLVLRNTGGRSCTVHGFGGLGLAAADGSALPTNQIRSGGPAATVPLAPGGAVRSALHWSTVNGPGEPSSGTCQPPAATLRVIPPDETDALSVAWTLGPVCSAGTIEQHPYAS